MKFSRKEIAWGLYDCGSSAFTLIVITTFMPIFFKDIVMGGGSDSQATTIWGYTQSIAMFIIAVTAPFLGAIADTGRKKMMLLIFAFSGAAATSLLFFTGTGDLFLVLGLYVIGRIGFNTGNIFYDSFLTDITTDKRINIISTTGFALGYVGSVIPFLACIALAMSSGTALSQKTAGIIFLITGIWWFVFTIPLSLFVKQMRSNPVTTGMLIEPIRRVIKTLKVIRTDKNLFYFIIAYFFYIDGVGTIVSMAAIYGREIGISTASLIMLILMIQLVAFPFTLLFGWLSRRYGARRMIVSGVVVYVFISVIGFFIPQVSGSLKNTLFWAMGFLVATSQGGIQALSRSFFASIIPPEKSAEMFGFYNIFGKFAAVIGPALLGLMAYLTGHSRWGILSLIILFFTGALILIFKVRDTSHENSLSLAKE